MSPTTWPELVGYRHEVLHTGVLAHLLLQSPAAAQLASAMTGADVTEILWARPESRIGDLKGRADLVAKVRVADCDDPVHLGIETKVDSNATREQLAETARPPDFGVLLAVGITALNLTEHDLTDAVKEWSVIGPARWAHALERAGVASDPMLAPYLAEVQREAQEHAAARKLARHEYQPDHESLSRRREDRLLEHYAWLAEVRESLDNPAPSEWWTYTNQSGPLMGLWREEFQRTDRERDTFIEFVCSDRRRTLCLKIGGGNGDLPAAAGDALTAVQHLGWQAGRRPRSSAGTCTAAWLDFTELGARAAAQRTRQAIAEVAGATAH